MKTRYFLFTYFVIRSCSRSKASSLLSSSSQYTSSTHRTSLRRSNPMGPEHSFAHSPRPLPNHQYTSQAVSDPSIVLNIPAKGHQEKEWWWRWWWWCASLLQCRWWWSLERTNPGGAAVAHRDTFLAEIAALAYDIVLAPALAVEVAGHRQSHVLRY